METPILIEYVQDEACEECGGLLAKDSETGEIVCVRCGLVQSIEKKQVIESII
jgi:transcription initiation factor TFIIIB Brf1 subunit/transcription initiation factor TFIIB